MTDISRYIFSGMHILHGRSWVSDQALVVENGKIKAIIPENMAKHHMPAVKLDYPANHYLIPGLIDLHVHGAKGSDVMDASAEAFNVISRTLAEEGVTGYLATTMTAANKDIEAVLAAVPVAMQQTEGAKILGVHLEGPFIAQTKKGAQSGEKVQLPNLEVIKKWQALAKNAIRMVTLAPELAGALPFIEALHADDIVVAMGHTDATYDQAVAAIKRGCSHATHLFNAMRALHQREPGVLGAALLAQEVTADLIVDGIHLHPAIVDLAYRLKGKDSLLLISDAIRAKCMQAGQYELGGQTVQMANGMATLADGTLAGSVLRLPQAIKNMMNYTSCTLLDAIYMASHNPAYKLGLETMKGSIEIGKDADLAVLNAELDVLYTMREGKEIFIKQ